MCSERRKNHGCGQKKPKSTSSAIFGVETACEKLQTQAVGRPSSNRTDKANLNFSPELYRLIFSPKLNFSPLTEKTTEYSFELFFPLTNLFLTFVVFACFATTRVNMRFHAKNTWDSTQGYIQCNPVVTLWCGRMDGRTHVQMVTCLLRHYQNFLA